MNLCLFCFRDNDECELNIHVGLNCFSEALNLLQNKKGENMILETERLILRELVQEDFDEVCKLLQDPVVMYAYEGAYNNQEVQEWLERQFRRYANDGFGLWGVVEKECGELIGQCGVTWQDCDGKRIPEVGYLLRKEFWHKGYATEAAIACKEYAFEKLGFDEVFSIIRDTNVASQNVASRNGMKKVAAFVKHFRGVDMLHLVFRVQRG